MDRSTRLSVPHAVNFYHIYPGSQASYVRDLLAIVSGPRSDGGLGYRGVVVNSRGCEYHSMRLICVLLFIGAGGNVPLRTPQISAGSPDDLRSSLLYLASLYPNAPIYAVGFSLGASVLTKYLGQEGSHSRIKAGCVIACVSRTGCPFLLRTPWLCSYCSRGISRRIVICR